MLIKQNRQIILASSSKIRAKILAEHGLKFEIIKPFYDEDNEKNFLPKMSCQDLSIFLAQKKALSVSEKFRDAIVIGVDQVCEFQKNAISKAQNVDQAIKQLTQFNGKIHYQNSGLVVCENNNIIFENFTKVRLKMRKLTSKQIQDYVIFEQSFGCAGSYKYESLGKHLFENINGDYFAVLGLSIQELLNFLHQNKIITI